LNEARPENLQLALAVGAEIGPEDGRKTGLFFNVKWFDLSS